MVVIGKGGGEEETEVVRVERLMRENLKLKGVLKVLEKVLEGLVEKKEGEAMGERVGREEVVVAA